MRELSNIRKAWERQEVKKHSFLPNNQLLQSNIFVLGHGTHPETGKALRPITNYIIKKY